jgi:D-alanyl-D-alanine carboxypeptidase
MIEAPLKHKKLTTGALVLAIALLLGLSVYGYLVVQKFEGEGSRLSAELEAANAALAEKKTQLENLEAMLSIIEQEYALSEESKAELLEMLTEEKNRNEEFADQIEDATRTVGKLDKLSKLDPELLMKYSKVYFLNEHYTPAKVAEIPKEFTFKKDEPEYVDAKVLPYLKNLLEDAKEDGIELLVVSGYRSYDEQKGLKSAYSVQYGTGANTFSADQGYSEHQLGTTVDFSTTAVGGSLSGFQNTEAYAWLTKYAYKYGFVLSYPEKNGYYIFEPWHWRFVGEDLADDLHDDKEFFYDLDQREIDTYLISIFD